jgi:hypothetical protein
MSVIVTSISIIIIIVIIIIVCFNVSSSSSAFSLYPGGNAYVTAFDFPPFRWLQRMIITIIVMEMVKLCMSVCMH